VSESWKRGGYFDLDRKSSQAVELRTLTSQADFWQDQAKAVAVGRQLESLESEVNEWQKLLDDVRQLEALVSLAEKDDDSSLGDEPAETLESLQARFTKLEFFVMFSGKYDEKNAILSIHAGTGGVDAQDWTQMLERMFIRMAERHNWKVEVIDRLVGNEAGIKSVSFSIAGHYAYGYLKSEAGVHRLVRISPFDSEGMRHTSFALVEVLPELDEDGDLVINPDELEIDFFRSSGPGGQNVNKTSSAVRITHKPTGIVVACQSERSQHQNRELAMKMLRGKLITLRQSERDETNANIKGKHEKAAWGKQIRSYVLQPYQLVKDHRTNHETADVNAILDGEIDEFIEAYLRNKAKT